MEVEKARVVTIPHCFKKEGKTNCKVVKQVATKW